MGEHTAILSGIYFRSIFTNTDADFETFADCRFQSSSPFENVFGLFANIFLGDSSKTEGAGK